MLLYAVVRGCNLTQQIRMMGRTGGAALSCCQPHQEPLQRSLANEYLWAEPDLHEEARQHAGSAFSTPLAQPAKHQNDRDCSCANVHGSRDH